MTASKTVRSSELMVPAPGLKEKTRLTNSLKTVEGSEAATRFLASYGKTEVKSYYAYVLGAYLKWLRSAKGAELTLDGLIRDNLVCVWKSDPVDVGQKRKHRAWLQEYVNVRLAASSTSYRRGAASIVKKFYEMNDSPLFGNLKIAETETFRPAKALSSSEIRAVLKALPLQQRVPLLCMWQSGCEVGKMLPLRWGDLQGLETGSRVKLEFMGRKRHKRSYFTFLGRDSVEALRLWRGRWSEILGREPGPDDLVFLGKTKGGLDREWLNISLKRMALRLSSQGLIQNGHRESWHTHYLRHSFKTEGEHAKVSSGIIEFFMGHLEGISWCYDNRDQVHEQDFSEAYTKLEPYVSLSQTEATLKEGYETKERQIVSEYLELKRLYGELKEELRVMRSAGPSQPAGV